MFCNHSTFSSVGRATDLGHGFEHSRCTNAAQNVRDCLDFIINVDVKSTDIEKSKKQKKKSISEKSDKMLSDKTLSDDSDMLNFLFRV